MAASEPIWVGMRLRPLVGQERGQPHCITIKDNVVSIVEEVAGEEPCKDFAFDVAMDSTDRESPSYVSQEKCYDMMGRRMLQHMLQGYNTCLFCYGQTGTGKTTTIMGKAQPREEQGLLLRLIGDIFDEVAIQQASGSRVHVMVQMLEVYNERLNDLLAAPPTRGQAKRKIDVHVHPEMGVYLTGATELSVENAQDCVRLIEYGNTMKVVHATAMNAQSSRGHTVFKLNMEKMGGSDSLTTSSEVCFADLAGRENERMTQVTGERLVELSFINRSLMWLATCIQSLGAARSGERGSDRRRTLSVGSANQAAQHASKKSDMSRFRNSKLTLLLSNALTGNSRTSMIGTLSPAEANFDESYSTLRFAATVKTIKLQAKAATAVDKDSLLKKLEEEVKELRQQLENAREKQDVEDISDIRSKIEATTAIAAVKSRDWSNFRRDSQQITRQRSETIELLTHFSHKRMEEFALPYLANYSDDAHLAWKLILHVPPDGEERSLGSDGETHFQLPPSLGISTVTAYVRNDGGRLWLRAAPVHHGVQKHRLASIEVNGAKLMQDEQELNHLDCILFGRSTIFYAFLHPVTCEELVEKLHPQDQVQFGYESGFTSQLVEAILGEERSKNALEVQLAKSYCAQIQNQHLDTEGNVLLRAFAHNARRARLKVEEANEITELVRPGEGLFFELVAQAPILSLGFPGTGNLPEICVRLMRRRTRAQQRWQLLRNSARRPGFKDVAEKASKIGKEPYQQDKMELLSTWTWLKFSIRLDLMHEVREVWSASRGDFKIDPVKDPWAETGPSELEQLQHDYAFRLQELRERARKRESKLIAAESRELEARKQLETATAKLKTQEAELEAAKAQIRALTKEKQVQQGEARGLVSCSPELSPSRKERKEGQTQQGEARPPSSPHQRHEDIITRGFVSRCVELSHSNKALLDSLRLEQRHGRSEASEPPEPPHAPRESFCSIPKE